MVEYTLYPTSTAATTDIDLPVNFIELDSVIVVDVGAYSGGTDVTPVSKTIVDSAPSAGEAWLNSETTFQLGDAITDQNLVIVRGLLEGGKLLPE